MTYRLSDKKAENSYPMRTKGALVYQDGSKLRYDPITYGNFLKYGKEMRSKGYSITYWFGMQDGPETDRFLYTDEITTMRITKNGKRISEVEFYTVDRYQISNGEHTRVYPTKANGRKYAEDRM